MNVFRLCVLCAATCATAMAFGQTLSLIPTHKYPPKLVHSAKPLGSKSGSDLLHISIGLRAGDPVGLQRFVDSVSDPKSLTYRHFIRPEEVGRRFGMSLTEVRRVSDYLKAYGASVRLTAKNRLSILADIPVFGAQAAFHTSIERFLVPPSVKGDSGLRYSFTSRPQLPAEVAANVINIGGLENFTRPKPMNLQPAQLQEVYGVSPLVGKGNNGQGRTIGITNFDGFRILNEIEACEQFNLPTPAGGPSTNITIEPVSGGNGVNAFENGEGDLDIQAVIGMAPLCNLIVYDNGVVNQDTYDPIGVLTQEADDDTADLISESYGWQFDTPTSLVAHNLHLSMSAEGITYVAASGDTGTQFEGDNYPQIDPEVLTVGGTSVTINSKGQRVSEVGWDNDYGAGGGGWVPSEDTFNVRPPYQSTPAFLAGSGVPSLQTVPYRLMPDISLDADPNTGYFIWINETEYTIGGTSGGSPTTAAALGICQEQLINDGMLLADPVGNFRFGRINDLLYAYNGDPNIFFDVTSGTNGILPNGQNSVAGPGWDSDSGWGPIIFAGLVARFEIAPAVASITINPSSVLGGTNAVGTVTLAEPATGSGATVTLAGSGPDVQVPSPVIVPPGATSATFIVSTNPVRATELVSISNTNGEIRQSASLTLTPVTLVGIAISPGSVTGGTSPVGTVTLSGNAPAGGMVVSLTSNSLNAMPAATVTVAPGSQSATFSIATTGVSGPTTATITANLAAVSQTASFVILPPKLLSITVTPVSAVGGSTTAVSATVSLNGPAGATGAVIEIFSSNSAIASLQFTNVIAAGSATGVFPITTFPVTSPQAVSISATFLGDTQSTIVMINPLALGQVVLNPTVVPGGSSCTGTVSLVQTPTVPITISLKSDSTKATPPPLVTIPSGAQSATFTVNTVGVSTASSATITAALGSNSQSARLSIEPATVQSITISPATVVGGSAPVATVTLNGLIPPEGDVVTVFSSNVSVATTPSSVTVQGGSNSATFSVSTLSTPSNQTTTITAFFNGSSKTANLTVTPFQVVGISLNPSIVSGGSPTTGTVTISQAAGAGGATVNLFASGTDVSVPATGLIPAGSSTGTFSAKTYAVASPENLLITAWVASVRKSVGITLLPASIGSLTVSPGSVRGGQSCTGAVQLSGVAPSAGLVVLLTSGNSIAKVPKSVTVPGGAGSVTFWIATSGVSTEVSMTISAKLSGSTPLTAPLTVTPPGLESFTLSSTSFVGGSNVNVTGTIVLTGVASASGETITLSSSNTKIATVPASVRVLNEKSSVSFPISHLRVGATQPLKITATLNGISQSVSATLTPIQIVSLSLAPLSVVGGKLVTGTITLNAVVGPRGGPLVVSLESNSKFAKAPAQLNIDAGSATGRFSISTTRVTSSTNATITAATKGSVQQATVSISPAH